MTIPWSWDMAMVVNVRIGREGGFFNNYNFKQLINKIVSKQGLPAEPLNKEALLKYHT